MGRAAPNPPTERSRMHVVEQPRRPAPVQHPPRTRIADIDPHTATAARNAGRVTDRPGAGGRRPVTFNSAT